MRPTRATGRGDGLELSPDNPEARTTAHAPVPPSPAVSIPVKQLGVEPPSADSTPTPSPVQVACQERLRPLVEGSRRRAGVRPGDWSGAPAGPGRTSWQAVCGVGDVPGRAAGQGPSRGSGEGRPHPRSPRWGGGHLPLSRPPLPRVTGRPGSRGEGQTPTRPSASPERSAWGGARHGLLHRPVCGLHAAASCGHVRGHVLRAYCVPGPVAGARAASGEPNPVHL